MPICCSGPTLLPACLAPCHSSMLVNDMLTANVDMGNYAAHAQLNLCHVAYYQLIPSQPFCCWRSIRSLSKGACSLESSASLLYFHCKVLCLVSLCRYFLAELLTCHACCFHVQCAARQAHKAVLVFAAPETVTASGNGRLQHFCLK